MHENQNKRKSTKVHWYNTTSKIAITDKYTLEMMECPTSRGNRKRKRNIRNTSTLHMQEGGYHCVLLYTYKSWAFKEVSNRHNKTEIAKSTRLLRSKAMLLDEDNAFR